MLEQYKSDNFPFYLPNLCEKYPLFFIILIGEIFTIVLLAIKNEIFPVNYNLLGLLSLFVQWVLLSSTCTLCLSRNWVNQQKDTISKLVCYIIPIFYTFIASFAYLNIIYNLSSYEIFTSESFYRNLIISAIISGIFVRYLVLQAHINGKTQSELQHKLQALQSRIQPHFLFNSLNTLISLIELDPNKASRMVEDLSSLFRANLADLDKQVPLTQEVKLCKQYLAIEQLRFGDRLSYEINLDETTQNTLIPLLTIQPLIENAIVHGISHLDEGGHIKIDCSEKDTKLFLKITNPFIDLDHKDPEKHNHMALRNIENRLNVLYAEQAKLNAYKENNLYIVEINYPIRKQSG